MNKLYLLGATALAGVGLFLYVDNLRDTNAALTLEVETKDLQIEVFESNTILLNEQLAFEERNRLLQSEILKQLHKEVSDEDYNQTLPSSVQNVLDDFHSRIRP